MLDQTMRTAQAGGMGEELYSGGKFEGLRLASLDLNGKHTAKIGHLGRGNLVSGMSGEAGIVYGFNLRLIGQELRDLARALRLRPHTIGKSLQAAQCEPAFEGRRYRTAIALDAADLLKQMPGLLEDQRAAEHVTMAGKVFCDRVHHHIRAELD